MIDGGGERTRFAARQPSGCRAVCSYRMIPSHDVVRVLAAGHPLNLGERDAAEDGADEAEDEGEGAEGERAVDLLLGIFVPLEGLFVVALQDGNASDELVEVALEGAAGVIAPGAALDGERFLAVGIREGGDGNRVMSNPCAGVVSLAGGGFEFPG